MPPKSEGIGSGLLATRRSVGFEFILFIETGFVKGLIPPARAFTQIPNFRRKFASLLGVWRSFGARIRLGTKPCQSQPQRLWGKSQLPVVTGRFTFWQRWQSPLLTAGMAFLLLMLLPDPKEKAPPKRGLLLCDGTGAYSVG